MVSHLIERIRKNDQRAMRQLYDTYAGLLASVCYRYVHGDDDAKDVLQNSFVKIFTQIGRLDYRGEAPLRAWMVRVVVNESLSFLRERRRLHFTEPADDIADDDEPRVEAVSADELHRLISEMPAGYRTVLNLYAFEQCSHKEIAGLLGISESTSASQLHYAKQWLARRIRKMMEEKR